MKRSRRVSPQACQWLAGLEAGVWAGVATLAWLAVTATWSQQSIWEAPNRLGVLFYGAPGWRPGIHAGTWAGLAFHLFTSGVVGLLFGALAREGRNPVRTGLLGMVAGLLWGYGAYAWFWRRLLPPASALPPPSLVAAYLVFGLGLACYPGRLRSAERHFLGTGAAPAQGPGPQGAPEGSPEGTAEGAPGGAAGPEGPSGR